MNIYGNIYLKGYAPCRWPLLTDSTKEFPDISPQNRLSGHHKYRLSGSQNWLSGRDTGFGCLDTTSCGVYTRIGCLDTRIGCSGHQNWFSGHQYLLSGHQNRLFGQQNRLSGQRNWLSGH